ncbi:conserved hypothetical protein [Erythrobacter sp. EC-HK427]|nr:conserved hypothetical protein [Erythrobacter sp. EC-HK427]
MGRSGRAATCDPSARVARASLGPQVSRYAVRLTPCSGPDRTPADRAEAMMPPLLVRAIRSGDTLCTTASSTS